MKMIIGNKYSISTSEYTYVGTLTKQFTGMIDSYSMKPPFGIIRVPGEFYELSDVSIIQKGTEMTGKCVAIIIPEKLIVSIEKLGESQCQST